MAMQITCPRIIAFSLFHCFLDENISLQIVIVSPAPRHILPRNLLDINAEVKEYEDLRCDTW
jgi:hypothetical protein